MRYSASKKITKLVIFESLESEPVNGFASVKKLTDIKPLLITPYHAHKLTALLAYFMLNKTK
jgi:hypothetical protein